MLLRKGLVTITGTAVGAVGTAAAVAAGLDETTLETTWDTLQEAFTTGSDATEIANTHVTATDILGSSTTDAAQSAAEATEMANTHVTATNILGSSTPDAPGVIAKAAETVTNLAGQAADLANQGADGAKSAYGVLAANPGETGVAAAGAGGGVAGGYLGAKADNSWQNRVDAQRALEAQNGRA